MTRDALDRLENTPATRDRLTKADFTFYTGTANDRSKIADFKLNRLVAVREGVSFDLSITAVETFTTDGTASNTETFNLSNDIVDSEAVADSLILYEGNSEVSADSVDYANNTFDYTDDGTANTLTAFYTSGDQARVEVEKASPNGVSETLFAGDVGTIHRRDQNRDPLTFDFNLGPLQPVAPGDFTIEVYVDAPYQAAFTYDATGDSTNTPATNSLLDIPIKGARGPVSGVAKAVRMEAAER